MDFINSLLAAAAAKGKKALSEVDCYKIFNYMGLDVPAHAVLARGANIAEALAKFKGGKVVIKIVSDTILHKTESGGVKICLKEDAPAVFKQMQDAFPQADTFMAVEFMEYPPFALGREILLGARYDKAFGPVISLGTGGTDAENIAQNLKNGTSIISAKDADFKKFTEESFIWRYAGGAARGSKQNVSLENLTKWVEKLAALMLHFTAPQSPFIIEELEINPLVTIGGKAYALDGVLRFKTNDEAALRPEPTAKAIEALLEPKTVGVVGVSETKMNMGRIILNNVIQAGFDINKLFIIKPAADKIDGVKCYASCKDLPETVDMLVVTVPAAAALDAVKDAALSGKVNGLVLITGGIGEKEGSAKAKEALDAIIAEGKKINPDFAVNGSNSLGIVSNPSKVNTLFIPKNKLTPPLGGNKNFAPCAFISQSGAFVISALGKMPEVKPEYCVMTGNQNDITVADYVKYLAQGDKVKVIMVYSEGLKAGDGIKMKEAIKAAKANGKNIVIYAAGRTPVGQKAVMGHTASIAGDFLTIKQIFERAGALVASTFAEFELLTRAALALTDTPPANNNVFMISNAGFETSGMADNILRGGPVKAAAPSPALKEKLQAVLAKYKLDTIVDVRNPFDITPMCPDAAALEITRAAAQSGEYGSIIFATIPLSPVLKSLKEEDPQIMPALAAISKEYKTPVCVSVSAGAAFDYYRQTATDAGLCVFLEADTAVRILTKFIP